MSSLNLERLILDSSESSIEIKTAAGQALDIDSNGYITANINGTVTVDATDLDIRQLVHTGGTPDSVQVGDGTEILLINADGSVNAVVTATDLDIRDLSAAQDNVAISDGTDTLAIESDGSINVNLAGDADDSPITKNPVAIGSKTYDQGSALAAVSAAGDAAYVGLDLYRRQFVNDAPNISAEASAVSVTTTEVGLGTAIAGRTRILIQNNGNQPIFVGPTGVTTATGLEVSKNSTLSLELGESIDLFGIASTGSQDVRILQLA